MTSETIRAVHSDDIISLLTSLGILDDVKSGEYNCSVCGDTISLESIACIYPENEQVVFVCGKNE